MIGLPEIIAGVMAIALNLYALTGGADFGGGVWDLFAAGPRRERQRELIAESIAPIWEANHVWLIVVVVVLFTAFPTAFSTLGIVLHIPITIMLLGIVMRGSAFVFRSYGTHPADGRRWGAAFAMASLVTPVLLGVIIGAIANGAVADAVTQVGSGSFTEVFVRPWAALFPFGVGLFALALFAFLAATYLTVETTDPDLRDDFRSRALVAALIVFVMGAAVGAIGPLIVRIGAAVAALASVAALWRRQFHLARATAAAEVTLILWGWLIAQYPYVLPPTLTIRDAAAPPVTLRLLAIGLAAGAVILVPSLRYMLRTFKARS